MILRSYLEITGDGNVRFDSSEDYERYLREMGVPFVKDMSIPYRYSGILTKLVDIAAGVFDAYAAAFGSVDRQGDRIVRGAFSRTIRDNGGRVPLCWQHDAKSAVGVADSLQEDTYGLKFRGRVTRKSQRGEEALALIEIGGLRCFSIGYFVRDHRMKGEIRELTDLELVEVSIVTVPANPDARIAA